MVIFHSSAVNVRSVKDGMTYFMSDLLQLRVSAGSKDLRMSVGVQPVIRIHGVLQRVERLPLQPQDSKELMRSTTSGQRFQGIGQLRFGPAADSHQVADLGTDRLTK